jgi:hypothetical protein
MRGTGDRRWEERRQAPHSVAADRRTGDDRRGRISSGFGVRDLDWLDRVSQTLQSPRQAGREREPADGATPPDDALDTLVTARHGIVGTVYAAWERVPQREQDGGRYRVFHGVLYRQVGSGALQPQSLSVVDDLIQAYEDVCARAYELIYARHPKLRARGEQRDGTVVILDDVVG